MPLCLVIPSGKHACDLWVESRRAGFLAISCAQVRVQDPNAVFSETAEALPPLTHSSPCDFAATHLRFGSNMVPICSLGIGDAEHCPGRPGRDSMEVLPGDSVKAPEGSYQKN